MEQGRLSGRLLGIEHGIGMEHTLNIDMEMNTTQNSLQKCTTLVWGDIKGPVWVR